MGSFGRVRFEVFSLLLECISSFLGGLLLIRVFVYLQDKAAIRKYREKWWEGIDGWKILSKALHGWTDEVCLKSLGSRMPERSGYNFTCNIMNVFSRNLKTH